jgi:hypothetical protein
MFYVLSNFFPIFPGYPKAFGLRLVDVPLDLDSAGRTYTGTVQHRYAGPYSVELFTAQPPISVASDPTSYTTGATITVTFRNAGTTVWTKTLGPNDYAAPFWTSGRKGGLMLAKYAVPKDVPQGAGLEYEFRVHLLDARLKEKYQSVNVVIGHASEE